MTLNFVFWVEFPSPHMLGLYRGLSSLGHGVEIVSLYSTDIKRQDMGWDSVSDEDFKLTLFTQKYVESKFFNKESNPVDKYVHVVQGVRFLDKLHFIRKNLILHRVRFFSIAEVPDTRKVLNLMLKFFIYSISLFLLRRYINGIFCIGSQSVSWYKKLPFAPRVIPFWYPIHDFNSSFDHQESVDDSRLRLLFVGRLVALKSLDSLFKSLAAARVKSWSLDVIGDGPEKPDLIALSESLGISNNIKWLGSTDQGTVRKTFCNYHFLVLPSVYDGWGAVVSESLIAGTRVIVSSEAGSSYLANFLPDEVFVFESGDFKDLCSVLEEADRARFDCSDLRYLVSSRYNHYFGNISTAKYFLSVVKVDL